MDRAQEAILAFIGNAEVERNPMRLSERTDRKQIDMLLAEDMVGVVGDELRVTIKGWRFLDSRNLQ